MTRRPLVLGAIGAAVLLVAGATPFALRHIPFFRVRRVELLGVRYLAPNRVLDAMRLAPDQNVFDPLGDAEQGVEDLVGVVSVRIERRLPGTLRVEVVERQPAAFVSGPSGMIALDCDAHPLPYDPAESGLDLPIVSHADTTLTRALCTVRASDSTMYQAVDVARGGPGSAVTLDLDHRRVLLPAAPTTEEIQAVGAVQRELGASGRSYRELDARFDGWIVARGKGS